MGGIASLEEAYDRRDRDLLTIAAQQNHDRVVSEAEAQQHMRDDAVRALVEKIANREAEVPQPPQWTPPPRRQRPPYTVDEVEELLNLLVGGHIPGRDGRWIDVSADPLSDLRAWAHDYGRYMQDQFDARWRATDEGKQAVAVEAAIAAQRKAEREQTKAKDARRLAAAQNEFAYLVGQGQSPAHVAAHIRQKYGDDA